MYITSMVTSYFLCQAANLFGLFFFFLTPLILIIRLRLLQNSHLLPKITVKIQCFPSDYIDNSIVVSLQTDRQLYESCIVI